MMCLCNYMMYRWKRLGTGIEDSLIFGTMLLFGALAIRTLIALYMGTWDLFGTK